MAHRSPIEPLPLRSELFSADQMERHGRTLAGLHRITDGNLRDPLLSRLAANETVLTGTCRRLTSAISQDARISPAGEWLLDNFHLIREQVAMARRHLPRGYSRKLPRLGTGPSAGLPRVYDLALETVSHGDGAFDADSLRRFVLAYQSVSPLKLGELWAIPIMLRLALIENLRRVSVRVAAGMEDRDLANVWADRMVETAERDPKGLILVIADMARSDPPIEGAFVAELARRLQGQSASLALALTWIEQLLAESHRTIEQLVQSENRQQASDQVSISNSIGGLRLLSAVDWREFVEATSGVERVLREDPGGAYASMDFATRDRYRHAIERIARQGHRSEIEVARMAIGMAGESASRAGADDRAAHVGFHLVGAGLSRLERAAGVGATWFGAARRIGRRFPLFFYLGAVAAVTVSLAASLAAHARDSGAGDAVLVLVTILALVAASQFSVTLVNWLATLLATPHALPRLDFSSGLPQRARTLVVVPTMLTGAKDVDALVESLEVRFLANRDPNLHFGLLTDFADAHSESLPEDEPLLEQVVARIEELNRRYAAAAGPGPQAGDAGSGPTDAPADASAFYLFHRPRRWNAVDRIWMGEERKRGKLGDLNALLREGRSEAFSRVVGATAILADVKYVITLDTDTQLPRDAARQMAGVMAHPLNRPRFDEPGKRTGRDVVTSGHAILQPRVSMSLPGANRSRYARVHGANAGIDPYTRAVSDVYQDVFDEGSFIGKGIYEVEAFERALKDRFPANRILSHDLLEGCYARAGLLSDTELFEAFPARYSAEVARRRRWIRGDWQIAGWLRRRVKGSDGRREANPLSMLSQWKIFDNLRRSLVPLSLTVLLVMGWTVLSPAWLWTSIVVGILLAPSLLGALSDIASKPNDVPLPDHLVQWGRTAMRNVAQAVFTLALLPYEAYFSTDAVVRTLARLLVTRRRLLEWDSSIAVDRAAEQRGVDLLAHYRSMAIAPAVAVATWSALALARPGSLVFAGPILLLWMLAPAIAWWASRPLPRRAFVLSADQTRFLRKLARRTWAYFETYVGPEDHWLPPDNVQEPPMARVAHRTSPTNMGLALLGGLAAYDFGYLSAGRLLGRTTDALRSMDSLERYRGHFYNWYDTRTLAPLTPHYVSTVDSGNLAGHLLTLRAGLTALADSPILNRRWLEGIGDTFAILRDVGATSRPDAVAAFGKSLAAIRADPVTLGEAWDLIRALAAAAGDLAAAFPDDDGAAGEPEPRFWARALAAQCADIRDDLEFLAPWLATHGAMGYGTAGIPTLREIAALAPATGGDARRETPDVETNDSAGVDRGLLVQGAGRAAERIASIDRLATLSAALADADYDFLYDPTRRQLVIGFNVGELRSDASHYDLLASEARLCTFVAISQGKLPQESWFALGRSLTSAGGRPVLMAWSGSMFEYLMPLLVMPTYENTLLDRTYAAAVERQIEYGRQRGVPWGMSECGYNEVDVQSNYQYRAFGVPGLGLKRGLGADLVVAPYASALALMVAPDEACLNLQQLANGGLAGRLGLFEAVDYTPSRLRRGEASAVVRSYMAHHQGMSLLAYAYVLLDRRMQSRFASDPQFQASLLLLQERVPRATVLHPRLVEAADPRAAAGGTEPPVRVITSPDTAVPEVHLLSNGRYHVMVTNAGGGSSRWMDLAVTRWREDATADNWGTFCYLRDEATGDFWSTAHQPTLRRAEHYEAVFSEGRAEFRRTDFGVETHTEIVVSPEDDIEIRRVHVANRTRSARTIEVTSYAEVVLAPAAADALHPAFSNLFVQTESVAQGSAILCSRRPRSAEEKPPWMFHRMTVHGQDVEGSSFETDRLRFIGRGGSLQQPAAMTRPGALSNTQGAVLDPVVAIRHRVTVDARATVVVDLVSGAAGTRDAALRLADKYQDRRLADRVFELTSTHSQVMLRQLNASEADAQLYGRLAGSVIYANASLRADASVIVRNRRGQSGLWGYAISGDLPIVLLQIGDAANIELVRQLVQAHAYWRLKGLAVDLVIWNDDRDVYRQRLQEQILGLIAAGVEAHFVNRPGGIFIRHAEQISPEDRVLFESVARVIVTDARGTLAEQVARRPQGDVRVARLVPTRPQRPPAEVAIAPRGDGLVLFNGTGGFAADGREYVIVLPKGRPTPAPWVNVVANPRFGAVVSESGAGYTWSENAHLFRLTPWHNDPVSEPCGEALFVRDEETGDFWSPTSSPRSGAAPYVTRHGFGYSVFEHEEDGIRTELTVFVALDTAVKYSVLNIFNESGRPRRLSVTGYVEWVLGDLRATSAMHVVTEIDHADSPVYARNPYNSEFSDWVAFFDVDGPLRSVSGDRTEFLGRNRSVRDPAAMYRTRLSGKTGAGLDPCAALQVPLDLAAGERTSIVFRLGAGVNAVAARALALQVRGSAVADEALDAVKRQWQRTLGSVQVETPDLALNALVNGWLVYQTIACRLWARTGFYQSGGAFGFRDQLQDVMALVHAEPLLARRQIALCAGRQFVEGDVQHWWHPLSGRGVRTRCSDDFLWLPLATCRYVAATGDASILDEVAPYLEGRPVNAEDDSYYDLPGRSDESDTVYRHCVRAIVHGLRFGVHGLPLMGTGDWNDGMNLVGRRGRGESVWLAFFLCHVLAEFAKLARMRADEPFAERCENEAAALRRRIGKTAWDGGWYRRAYFDDGSPLGSATNPECRIDSVSQSWAVLSGAGDPGRCRDAMNAVYERLVRHDDRLVQLLDPPFDASDLDPGYIRGYVPGVRENGGQYTHAAIWTAMAFAALGDGDRAWELTAMINPINHALTPQDVATYKVEPYVVAADVYASTAHAGRGGWSWYTGSAGWMYRLLLESLLGLTLEGDRLRVEPRLPQAWDGFSMRYRYRDTWYAITVARAGQAGRDGASAAIVVDGVAQEDGVVRLADDGREHRVQVTVASLAAKPRPLAA